MKCSASWNGPNLNVKQIRFCEVAFDRALIQQFPYQQECGNNILPAEYANVLEF
jgi:hypothetical protein